MKILSQLFGRIDAERKPGPMPAKPDVQERALGEMELEQVAGGSVRSGTSGNFYR